MAWQWALEQAALSSPVMAGASPYLSGTLLIAAGIYQSTPLKHACLENRRAPAEFLSWSWRNGTGGAIAMGVHHGGYCWLSTGLLFVVGVMNPLWIAAVTAVALIEKIAPGEYLFARAREPRDWAMILRRLGNPSRETRPRMRDDDLCWLCQSKVA